jgi:hypothetical protein
MINRMMASVVLPSDYQVLADFATFLVMHTEIRGIDTH